MRVRILLGVIAALAFLAAVVALEQGAPDEETKGSDDSALTAERARIREFWSVYRQATAHRIAGRLEEAAADYRKALELNPEHEDALYYYANMEIELGALERAEQALRRLVEVNPASARAHSRLGVLYSCPEIGRLYDLSAAEREFLRAHEINLEETGPTLHLGEVALMKGKLLEAGEWLDAVIGSNYSSVPGHFLRGYVAWKLGEREDAARLFARAVEFARPQEPTEAVLEGETKEGSAPMLAGRSRCARLGDEAADLRSVHPSEARSEMVKRYRHLDEVLEGLPRGGRGGDR